MKRFYLVWFFICSGWGYLMAQPAPASFAAPLRSAWVAFPAAAFWVFVLVAIDALRTAAPRRLSRPSLSLKPWVMPAGLMLFVLLTVLFSSIWGLACAALLPAARVQMPLSLFAMSCGGVVGLWAAPHAFPSRFHG